MEIKENVARGTTGKGTEPATEVAPPVSPITGDLATEHVPTKEELAAIRKRFRDYQLHCLLIEQSTDTTAAKAAFKAYCEGAEGLRLRLATNPLA